MLQEYHEKHVIGAMRSDLFSDTAPDSQQLCTLEPPLPPPPDLTSVLDGLIAGTSQALQRPAPPLLVARGAAVVQRSCDVLAMFRVLHHSLEDCAAAVRHCAKSYMQFVQKHAHSD